jgi:hypothetical protein
MLMEQPLAARGSAVLAAVHADSARTVASAPLRRICRFSPGKKKIIFFLL